MAIKTFEKLHGKDLIGLLSEGMEWISAYSRLQPPENSKNCYDSTQAMVAAVLRALRVRDVEAFMKIQKVDNLSCFQDSFVQSWLENDLIFSNKTIKKCSISLAMLVVEEMVSLSSPLVTVVSRLEVQYGVYGVFLESVILFAKKKWKVNRFGEDGKETKSVSTQTCFEVNEAEYEERNVKADLHIESVVNYNINEFEIPDSSESGIEVDNIPLKKLLQYSVERGTAATVNKRMKLSGNLKNEDKSIAGLVNIAVKRNCIRVLRTLLWHKLDTHFIDEEGNAPLHIAASSNYTKTVRMLIQAGSSVTQSNAAGLLPLHLTTDPKIIKLLIDAGADVNAKTLTGDTALHLAVSKGNIDGVKALIHCGANPNEINSKGLTPLFLAVQSNNQEIVDILDVRKAMEEIWDKRKDNVEIGSGAVSNVSIPQSFEKLCYGDVQEPSFLFDDFGFFYNVCTGWPLETVIGVSEQEEKININGLINKSEDKLVSSLELKHLQNSGLNSDFTREELRKDGPIHEAAIAGRLDEVSNLLDDGVEVDATGCSGYTALQYAAKYGHLDIVQSLIQRGADVDKGNDWNWTPLHHAAYYSRYDIVDFLLEAGADPQVVDSVYGKTPLSWATGNFKIIKLFKSKGACS